jgi:Bacterial PH domain
MALAEAHALIGTSNCATIAPTARPTKVTVMSSLGHSPDQDIRDRMSGELRPMGVRKPLEQRLPALLEHGETVSFIGICTPAGRWWREALDAHVFVATDRRLLLIYCKFLLAKTLIEEAEARQPKSIHYRDIRAVKLHRGLLESKLDIEVGDDETIRLTSMRRKGARAATDAIQRYAPLRPFK